MGEIGPNMHENKEKLEKIGKLEVVMTQFHKMFLTKWNWWENCTRKI